MNTREAPKDAALNVREKANADLARLQKGALNRTDYVEHIAENGHLIGLATYREVFKDEPDVLALLNGPDPIEDLSPRGPITDEPDYALEAGADIVRYGNGVRVGTLRVHGMGEVPALVCANHPHSGSWYSPEDGWTVAKLQKVVNEACARDLMQHDGGGVYQMTAAGRAAYEERRESS